MDKRDKTILTIRTTVLSPVSRVWHFFTHPHHIVRWNAASDDWHCPQAANDLRIGGHCVYRMESRNGEYAFDFGGEYTDVQPNKFIAFVLGDGRRVEVNFEAKGDSTIVTEQFEAESMNPEDMQLAGWQAILNNFAAYTERTRGDNPIHFEIMIAATPEKVEQLMLADKTYREWTAIFNPGSFYEGGWEEGAEIRFVGIGEDGVKEGMIGHIAIHKPQQYVSIAYDGMILKGQDHFTGADVEALKNAREEYRFVARDGQTLLVVDLDDPGPYADYFAETWPKAMEKLKEICER